MPEERAQPNVLFIHSDQHRWDCVGANGHPFVHTPHLDGLAAAGVSFDAAYTPSPVCTPARNSLLYGIWPTRHGAISNRGTEAGRPAVNGLTPFSRVLYEAGYRLSYHGKWGIAGDPLQLGFDTYHPGQAYPRWRAAQGLPPQPTDGGWLGGLDPHVAPEQTQVGWEATQVCATIAELAAGDRPWLIRWDPAGPHLPNIVPEPYFSLYPPTSIPPWPSFPDLLVGKPYIQGRMRRTWQVDDWAWEQWAPLVSVYLAQITLMDAQIGRVLKQLEALGQAGNTIVMYSCDHGDLCGGHGMMDKHHVMYEDVVHVPLIVRWPGQTLTGHRCDAFISHELDLAATLCELAGAPIPAGYQGASLLPLLRGRPQPRPDYAYSTYFGSQFGLYSQRMVRDRRWKFVWNATAENELYDLEADPAELVNRAGQPRVAEQEMRLRRQLVTWMEGCTDPLLNQWTRHQLLGGVQ